jgi:hypothetical protein
MSCKQCKDNQSKGGTKKLILSGSPSLMMVKASALRPNMALVLTLDAASVCVSSHGINLICCDSRQQSTQFTGFRF